MGESARGSSIHYRLIRTFIPTFMSYTGAVIILKMRGYVDEFMDQLMLIYSHSNFFRTV